MADRQLEGRDLLRVVATHSVVVAACRVALHPLAVLKTHAQVQAAPLGLLGTAQRVLASQGWTGLFRGLPASLLTNAPTHAVHLAVLQAVLSRVSPEAWPRGLGEASSAAASALVAATAASVAAQTVLVPGEVIASRRMIHGTREGSHLTGSSSSLHLIRHAVSRHGLFRGVFRGWTAAVALDLPYQALWWFVYVRMKGSTGPWRSAAGVDVGAADATRVAAYGAAASCVAVPATHAIDVAKTRLQALDGPVRRTVARVTAAAGSRHAWRGMGARLPLMVSWGALGALAYEFSVASGGGSEHPAS